MRVRRGRDARQRQTHTDGTHQTSWRDPRGEVYCPELKYVLDGEWVAGTPATDLPLYFTNGPAGLVLKGEFGSGLHAVYAEALDRATLRILDPWPPGVGMSYRISFDAIDQYVHGVIARLK